MHYSTGLMEGLSNILINTVQFKRYFNTSFTIIHHVQEGKWMSKQCLGVETVFYFKIVIFIGLF